MNAVEIAASVRTGRRKASAIVEETAAAIAARNPAINAFTDLTLERARKQARQIDGEVAAGRDPGPLAGVPFAVKNLFDIAGLPTRAGSKINRDRPPAEQDAVLVRRLSAAGAILVGALNMGEYAYDFTGENCHDGDCRNPHDPSRMTGGSSSGSAAALAAGLVPLALGSDTNGSIRVPAALCGVFGLKPTYGRLPREGSFPFCDSLDHVGPMAGTAGDLALAFGILDGTMPALEGGIEGLRIAVAGDFFARGGTEAAHRIVQAAADALSGTREIVIPHAATGRMAAFLITASEGGALHLERLKARAADFDPDTRFRFLAGAMIPGAWYHKAQRIRRWYRDQVAPLFQEVDAILAPATPCEAPKRGEKWLEIGGERVPLRANLGLFTQPISCIGLPVVVAPIRRPGALPLGVQIIAAPRREDVALRVAAELERRGLAG